MNEAGNERMQILADKQEIYEVVVRCARGSDRFDMELFRSAFHPDAVMLYDGLFEGDAELIFTRVGEFLEALDGTMHVIANHLADVRGDVAYAETYVNAYHWGAPAGDPSRNFSTGTRYVDKFERREGQWKIARRISLRNFIRPEPELRVAQSAEGRPQSRRDRTDPSYLRD